LIAAVGCFPQLQSVGIVFVGQNQMQIIRPSSLPEGLGTWVVVHEIDSKITPAIPIRAIDLKVAPAPPDALTVVPLTAVTRQSREMEKYFLKATAGLVSVTLIGLIEAGSAAAIPFTGGTSSIITVLGWAGGLAVAAQCGKDIGMFINSLINPE